MSILRTFFVFQLFSISCHFCLSFIVFGTDYGRKVSSSALFYQPHSAVQSLISLSVRPQSKENRKLVESQIHVVSELANHKTAQYKKSSIAGAWRTVWTTVTSDNVIGNILRNKPSNILGGESWQVVDSDERRAENIVFWEAFDLRMAGLAAIQTFSDTNGTKGYILSINGLQFRWGQRGVLEKAGIASDEPRGSNQFLLFKLEEGKSLR